MILVCFKSIGKPLKVLSWLRGKCSKREDGRRGDGRKPKDSRDISYSLVLGSLTLVFICH